MKVKNLSLILLSSVVLYSFIVYILSITLKFSMGIEFFIAIFFIIAYFLFAFAFLFLSLNQKNNLFFKVFFLGSIIRIVASLILFLIILKLTNLDALKILIFVVPIYFIFLIVESLWVHKNVPTMENKNDIKRKDS